MFSKWGWSLNGKNYRIQWSNQWLNLVLNRWYHKYIINILLILKIIIINRRVGQWCYQLHWLVQLMVSLVSINPNPIFKTLVYTNPFVLICLTHWEKKQNFPTIQLIIQWSLVPMRKFKIGSFWPSGDALHSGVLLIISKWITASKICRHGDLIKRY